MCIRLSFTCINMFNYYSSTMTRVLILQMVKLGFQEVRLLALSPRPSVGKLWSQVDALPISS